MTRIAIDRAKGTIEKSQGFSFWKKRRSWQLGLFETVRLKEQAAAIEEGYAVTSYSLFLEARDLSLELLSTDDEQYARSLHKDLSELLAIVQSIGK